MWIGVLKDSTLRIVHGMLFGLGFGIAAGAIYYYVSEKMVESMMSSSKSDALSERLVITSHERVRRDDVVHILGVIENRNVESVRSVNVQADLFDVSGKFVDQCSGHTGSSGLKPGEQRHFKITCGSKDRPVAEHTSYKLRVGGW